MKMKRVLLAMLVMVLAFSLIPLNASAATKKNASDLAALHKIINAQKKQGALMSSDMNFYQYKWNSQGRLVGIDWYNCLLKGSISFAGLPELTDLSCENNMLSKLDVSKNKKLTDLSCSDNKISSLDVSVCTGLKTLWCENNKLTSLDVSSNTKLKELYCKNNKISILDVTNCPDVNIECDKTVEIIGK